MNAKQVREYIDAVNPKMTTPTPKIQLPEYLCPITADEFMQLRLGDGTDPRELVSELWRDLAARDAELRYVRETLDKALPGMDEGAPIEAIARKVAAHIAAREAELAELMKWKERVLDELIVAHIYTKEHDTNPKKAIHDAIVWNCQVAIDPAVSSDARKLIAQERERCAKVCDAYSEELRPYAEREYSRDDAIARDCAAAIRRGE